MRKIRVGISRCLLGDEVRFDGGHKHDPFLTETLGRFFEWVPVCPEVEMGMAVPRESVRLLHTPSGTRMVGVRSEKDFTLPMTAFCSARVGELNDLHGYILKKDSPSCGMDRVRVYSREGIQRKNGRGLFAAALQQQYPMLPVEEEGRLHDLPLRENFIERIFCYYRFTNFLEDHPTEKKLVEFHTRHKMTLLSHSTDLCRVLGRIVARPGKKAIGEVVEEYGTIFTETLKRKATPRKHANVLYHLMGYLKQSIDTIDKAELVARIEEYRTGLLPLIVPITLLKHHFQRNPVPWIEEQTYLNPYPVELMLRNHG